MPALIKRWREYDICYSPDEYGWYAWHTTDEWTSELYTSQADALKAAKDHEATRHYE